MEQSEYDALFVYLSKRVYPRDKQEKNTLKKAEKFNINNGEQFYVGNLKKAGDKPQRIIKTNKERRRILDWTN